MDATLELAKAVAIIVLAPAAEGIATGSAGSKAIFCAAHLFASRAGLEPWALRTKPVGVIIAIEPLAVGLLAA